MSGNKGMGLCPFYDIICATSRWLLSSKTPPLTLRNADAPGLQTQQVTSLIVHQSHSSGGRGVNKVIR